MQQSEVAMLLAFVHSVQGGETNDIEVAGWFDTLGHLDYQDALAAAKAHARESSEHMKPAHIIGRVLSAGRAQSLNRSPLGAHWVDCAEQGRAHKWLTDGTCVLCEQRRDT